MSETHDIPENRERVPSMMTGGDACAGGNSVPFWQRRCHYLLRERMIVTVAFVATAAIGACWIHDELGRSAQGAENQGMALSAGSNVHSETIALQLPAPLRELADPRARARIASSPESLRRFLEERRGQNLICTVIIRGYQADGAHSDIAFLRNPCEESAHFQELWGILSGSDGNEGTADGSVSGLSARITAEE